MQHPFSIPNPKAVLWLVSRLENTVINQKYDKTAKLQKLNLFYFEKFKSFLMCLSSQDLFMSSVSVYIFMDDGKTCF
jgi:hypothetical protein